MARKEKSKLRQMIEKYRIKDMNDVHEFVKMRTAETIQAALDAEFKNDLGYSKYDYKNKRLPTAGTDILSEPSRAAPEKWKYKYHGTATANLDRSL